MRVETVTLSMQDLAAIVRDAVRDRVGCDVGMINVVTQRDDMPNRMLTVLAVSKSESVYGAVSRVQVSLWPNVGPTSHSWEE